MSRRLTNKIVDQRLSNRPIKRIGEYTDAHTKIEWKCLECDNIWCARYANISQNTGCPKCGLKHTPRAPLSMVKFTNMLVDERISMRNDHIYRIGDVIDSSTKIEWGCKCGHSWFAIPTQIVTRNTGCPRCNKKGQYNIEFLNEGELCAIINLYFIKFISKIQNISFIKIGITKQSLKARFANYHKNYNIETLIIKQLSLLECINLEQEIIHKFSKFQYIPEGNFPGKTECFIDTPEVKESILKLLE